MIKNRIQSLHTYIHTLLTFPKGAFQRQYVWVIDQARGQDGWILAKFFFASLWTETKSRSIKSQKRTRPISSHLDRTNLVNKGFIIWLLVMFCLRDTAGSPERARWLHLAPSGSQSQRAIWFILPAHGASHIIITNIN